MIRQVAKMIETGLPEQSEQLRSEARRWIVLLRSGEASQRDIDALAGWRARSQAHRRALAEAGAQWGALQFMAKKTRHLRHAPVTVSLVTPNARGLTRRAWLGGALAASIGGVGYLVVQPPLGLWPSLLELSADYRTDVGERRDLALADSVSVEMNTRTSIGIAAASKRQIELISGEIAVTADAARTSSREPFVVAAGRGRTSAVRAAFDLRHEGESVSVFCLDGDLRVECGQESANLKGGQQVAYDARGLGSVAESNTRIVEAWRRGLLVFDNKPLSEVVSEINRYRRGRIVLMNEEIGRLALDATFRLDRVDEVVSKIVHFFGLKARSLPGGIVLLS
jgi:transmembrane sensor